MCQVCASTLDRRNFLKTMSLMTASLAAAVALPGVTFAAEGQATTLTADEALAKLKAGNDRYVSNAEVCAADLLNSRQRVVGSQAPWATILSCSDSRVPPELLFGGVGLGDLFVARNAGNMAVDSATMGTIEYGAAVLGAPLVVVLGHERCGAVVAACEVVEKKTKFPGSIGPLVQAIVPTAKAVHGRPGDFVDNAVRESATRTAAKIATQSKIIRDLVKSGKVKVVAARYDLKDGKVQFFSSSHA